MALYLKKFLAKTFDVFGINKISLKKINNKYKNNYIRVVNYHGIAVQNKENFEKQIRWILKNFEPCDFNKLKLFLANQMVFTSKPGIIFTFDDGFKNNFTVAYPILQKYSISAFFFVSTGLIGKENHNNHNLDYMNEKELLELINNNQTIGCHTYSHHRMSINDSNEVLNYEIYSAKKDLELKLNYEIDIFCWCGGEEEHYTKKASDFIKNVGYKYSFLTCSYPILQNTNCYLLERTNLEAAWSMSLIKFQLSGFMDLKVRAKRKRVENLLR